MISLALILVLAASQIFLLLKILQYWKDVMKVANRIPGPEGRLLIGILHKFFQPPEKIWQMWRSLSIKYYPMYKYYYLCLPIINIVGPDEMEAVLSSTKYSTKSIIYNCLRPWLGTGLLTSGGRKWHERRKILTPAFHFTILQQFFRIFVEESQLLVQRLEDECNKPQTDVIPFVGQFTLHTICGTAMGIKISDTDKKLQKYFKAIHRMGEIIIYRLTRPWIFLNITFVLSLVYVEHQRLLKMLHAFSNLIIKERELNFKDQECVELDNDEWVNQRKRLAMLDLLISAKRSGHPIDNEGIREEVDTFMFEGHDTTNMCISFTLLLLANHADVQDKVVQELQGIFGDSDRAATFQDVQDMRYLDLVLKESLRLYPSVPFISRVSPENIQTPSGLIPKNSIIQLHIYDMHHNPNVYPEPEKFDPDRFLPENCHSRHPFAYIPFSAGPRNCIGQKFATLEIKTAIAAILRKFVLKPVDTPSDISMIVHLVLKTKNGIKVKFEKRFK